jgi:hypothetical protein
VFPDKTLGNATNSASGVTLAIKANLLEISAAFSGPAPQFLKVLAQFLDRLLLMPYRADY